MPQRTPPPARSATEEKPPPHWGVVLFMIVTMVGAAGVGLTATDHFTRLTMLAGVLACVVLWQTLRDSLVMVSLTIVILGAVLGWGLDFYDRIWWYDDIIHFLFSLVAVMAIARLTLYRFHAEPVVLLPVALWLAWLGIGSLWEIGEWAADRLESTSHSRGYLDTMTDMILNSLGSIVGIRTYWRWFLTPADRAALVRS